MSLSRNARLTIINVALRGGPERTGPHNIFSFRQGHLCMGPRPPIKRPVNFKRTWNFNGRLSYTLASIIANLYLLARWPTTALRCTATTRKAADIARLNLLAPRKHSLAEECAGTVLPASHRRELAWFHFALLPSPFGRQISSRCSLGHCYAIPSNRSDG